MNPEEILPNANIFSITDLTLPLTMLPARDRITGQIKRTALPRSASPCKRKEANRICGHGGIGRLGGFRFHCESVQVRVLLPAPRKGRPEGLPFLGVANRTRRGRHRQRRGKKHACDMFFSPGKSPWNADGSRQGCWQRFIRISANQRQYRNFGLHRGKCKSSPVARTK